jgi:TrmH family RNA methyltransferase
VSADALPAIVLVRPQEPGNVGAVARAMANTGLVDLRLVEPAAELDEPAWAFAMHAHDILRGLRRYGSLADAVADRGLVVATASLRERPWPQPVLTPRDLATRLAEPGHDPRLALVFGSEVSGLTAEELARAALLVRIPAAPANPTLNLAQAVLVVAYELYLARGAPDAIASRPVERAPARQIERLFASLERLLEEVGFARDTTIRRVSLDLRQLLARAELSQREAMILAGILRRARHAMARRERRGERSRRDPAERGDHGGRPGSR